MSSVKKNSSENKMKDSKINTGDSSTSNDNLGSNTTPATSIVVKKNIKKRGFGSMSPEKQKMIASMGGKASHAKGTAHRFNPEEAREAGRKGGLTTSQNASHMAEIGRKGGKISRRSRSKSRLLPQ